VTPRIVKFSASIGVVLGILLPLTGLAAQSESQQACINEINRSGAALAAIQSAENQRCVKLAGAGMLNRIAITTQYPAAQACLTRDPWGRFAKGVDKLVATELAFCLTEPEALPDFGYTSSGVVARAARSESIGILQDLFGHNLDAAIVDRRFDPNGARCQGNVLRATGRVFDALWRVARLGKRNGLSGTRRLAGSHPDSPVESGPELQSEILATVLADPRGAVRKRTRLLRTLARKSCQGAATPIEKMFPAVCSQSRTPAALARCAEGVARRRFFSSLAAFDGFTVSCDLLDNGRPDLSCVSDELVEHVLQRIGYGPDPHSVARVKAVGLRRYIEEQLNPETVPDDDLETLLLQFPSLQMSFTELRENYPRNPPAGQPGSGEVLRELQSAKLLRSAASHRQLEQVLTDFWFNHFNVMVTGPRRRWDITPYERDSIRPHVLGHFPELLLSTARSPAMGDYLDNRRNRVGGINENYARELMELHTLGVDGGFSEPDVVEVARCFTGWRENYNNEDGFEFRESWHDQGPKEIMGALKIPANGEYEDGVQVVEFLSSHENTAERISRKLAQRFVSEDPPAALVARATATFLKTDGNLRKVMETILLSPEFLLFPHVRDGKAKRPLVLVASLVRSLNADPAALQLSSLRASVRNLGEDLFRAAPPTGYSDVSGFWVSAGTMLLRFNRLERAARGRDGFSFDLGVTGGSSSEMVDGLIDRLFLGAVSEDTRSVAIAFLDLLEGRPDPRRVEQATAVLLSSPEFQNH
jgi:hypothetical protein